MKDDMLIIRNALEFGAGWFKPPNAAFQEHSPSREIFVQALAALSRLAEPGEDARELCKAIADKIKIVRLGPGGYSSIATLDDSAAALIESALAKAREEERERCAERADNYIKKSYNPRLGVQVIIPDELRAAIKEAVDGD